MAPSIEKLYRKDVDRLSTNNNRFLYFFQFNGAQIRDACVEK